MGRTIPTDCAHGVTVDWGDFGPCQNCDEHPDEGCPNLVDCAACEGDERRTLDDEQVCVRCGASDLHCQCEDVSEDGHWWVEPSVGANNTEWTICMKCGNVQRRDGKPPSQCRGPVRVALRAIPQPTERQGNE